MSLKNITYKTVYAKAITIKKAAMFGIDARVALAIFAILAIVISANIYKITMNVNIDKILTEASAIGKSVESYQKSMNKSIFDTVNPALSSDDKEKAAFTALYKNENLQAAFTAKWDGPYLNVKYQNSIEPFTGKNYRLARLSESTSTTCNNTASNPCYVFLKFKNLQSDECDTFEDQTSVTQYTKVYRQSASSCNILIKIGLDY